MAYEVRDLFGLHPGMECLDSKVFLPIPWQRNEAMSIEQSES
jgi:hypothetical protein